MGVQSLLTIRHVFLFKLSVAHSFSVPMALGLRMFGRHATSCVHHTAADLTPRWEEVCFDLLQCPTGLSLFPFLMISHALGTRLDNRVSPHGNRFSCTSTCNWFSSTRGDFFDRALFGCCGSDSQLGSGLLRFQVDRARHQEEVTSSAILTACSDQALRFGFTGPCTHIPTCGRQLS